MLHDPGLLQPESLSPWQATTDSCLHRKHSNTQRQVWLSLCGVSGSWCTQGFLFETSKHLWRVWGLILNVISLLLLLVGASPLPVDEKYLFLVESNIFLSMGVQQ